MLHIQYFKAIERSKQWLQTDLNSEPDSIITRASDLPPLSRLFISEMGTTNAFLMGFCEEQIRRGCKMLGAASCLFSRHCRVQTKRSKCPPNNLSLRLSSPWYDKHLILVKGSFWSGFPFMQRLKDARVTQVQLLFRLAKGGHGMLRAFVPHPAPPPAPHRPFSSLYKLTEGRTLFQELPTAKMNGMAPKKLSLRQLTAWGVSWKTYMPSHGSHVSFVLMPP